MKAFLDSSFLIYLNATTGEGRKPVEELFGKLLGEDLFTNALVIDEVLYISRRKYEVPYQLTMEFVRTILLPYAEIIPIDETDLRPMEEHMLRYDLKPSDSIHLATMEKVGIKSIVSEDEGFDKVRGVERIWIKSVR